MIEAAESVRMYDATSVCEPETAAVFYMHERQVEQPVLRDKQDAEEFLVLRGTGVISGPMVSMQ